jgi:hypothetical protein
VLDVAIFQPGGIAVLRSGIDEIEAKLGAVARSVGGEYDGLEWTLSPPSRRRGRT